MPLASRWTVALLSIAASVTAARGEAAGPTIAQALTTATGDEIYPSSFEQLFSLTIDNYIAWCTVTVNNGTPGLDPAPAASPPKFDEGKVVPLHADTSNAVSFTWGYWTGTDFGGQDANKSTLVTMTADKSLFVCCPLNGSSTCP